jgi:hypothetical protein
MTPRLSLFAVALLFPLAAAAQAPRFSHARVETRPVVGTLDATIRGLATKQADPMWIGYAVPAIPGDRRMCCWNGDDNGCCGACRLEPGVSSGVTFSTQAPSSVVLESGETFFVLARFEQSAVTRIRIFSEECALDAGDRVVHWLTDVRPAESVAWLGTFLAGADNSRRLADSALSALALHREPAALERLLGAAREGATTHVRGQALFWLAQRAGDKAIGAISDAIAKDPETDVKRRAVFALSQLPAGEGVPMMIQVARTNANPAVRKQAMFWLGQSKDPRALRFFEEILFK